MYCKKQRQTTWGLLVLPCYLLVSSWAEERYLLVKIVDRGHGLSQFHKGSNKLPRMRGAGFRLSRKPRPSQSDYSTYMYDQKEAINLPAANYKPTNPQVMEAPAKSNIKALSDLQGQGQGQSRPQPAKGHSWQEYKPVAEELQAGSREDYPAKWIYSVEEFQPQPQPQPQQSQPQPPAPLPLPPPPPPIQRPRFVPVIHRRFGNEQSDEILELLSSEETYNGLENQLSYNEVKVLRRNSGGRVPIPSMRFDQGTLSDEYSDEDEIQQLF